MGKRVEEGEGRLALLDAHFGGGRLRSLFSSLVQYFFRGLLCRVSHPDCLATLEVATIFKGGRILRDNPKKINRKHHLTLQASIV